MSNTIVRPICCKCKQIYPDIFTQGKYFHQFCLTGVPIFTGNKLLELKVEVKRDSSK